MVEFLLLPAISRRRPAYLAWIWHGISVRGRLRNDDRSRVEAGETQQPTSNRWASGSPAGVGSDSIRCGLCVRLPSPSGVTFVVVSGRQSHGAVLHAAGYLPGPGRGSQG